MRCAIGFLVVVLSMGAAGTALSLPSEDLLVPFDPERFTPQEIRLVETALAAGGDFSGTADADWDRTSDAAMAAYSAREFGESPRDLHAAALVIALLADVETDGWAVRHFDDLGMTMALPEAIFDAPEPEDSGLRWWSRTGSLTLLTYRFEAFEAEAWHVAAAEAHSGAGTAMVRRDADLWITSGAMSDGRNFHTRSERHGGVWSTVFLASGPDEAGMLNLIRTSLGAPSPSFWDLPPGGHLDGLVRDTLAIFDAPGTWADTGPAPGGFGAGTFAPDGPEASGTAFHIGPQVLVTADHVVAGCARLALASGAPVTVIASNSDLDIALLTTTERAETWLSLPSPDADTARLGQRVHAAGYPYFGIASSALHLTGGNVSARTGLNDDARFFSFTAPVQPGNSGGPLVDATGALVGLVVSRLSERYIAEATGSLPQNINYALHVSDLNDFVIRNGVQPAAARIGRFDMESGAPEGFEAAIVPVLCN